MFGDDERHDTEFEFNLGYYRQLDDVWALSFSHAWLEYNRVHQPINHDYRELRLNLHYADQFSLFVGHTDSIWNTGHDLTTISLTGRYSLPHSVLLEAEIGWLDFASNPRTDFFCLRVFP